MSEKCWHSGISVGRNEIMSLLEITIFEKKKKLGIFFNWAFFKNYSWVQLTFCSWECVWHYGTIEIEPVPESRGRCYRTRQRLGTLVRVDVNLGHEDWLKEPEGPEQGHGAGWSQRPGRELQVSGASETRCLKGKLVAEQSQQNVKKLEHAKGWRTPRKISTAGTR